MAVAGTTVKYDCMAWRKRRMYCLGEMMVGSCRGTSGRRRSVLSQPS